MSRWRPLLEGALREQALGAVRDIAEALRDPILGGAQAGAESDATVVEDFSLCTGLAGIALFHGYLAEAGLPGDAREVARRVLEEAEAALAEQKMGPSLCAGFAGIGWAHAHIRRGLFGERGRATLAELDEALTSLLSDWPWPTEFDLLYGLVGIGVYALANLPSRRARTIVRLVVERLAESAVNVDGLAAWATAPGEQAFTPDGEFNLGLAHGTPSVVGFLGRVAAAGIAPRTTLPLLQRATDWLLTQQQAADRGSAYPRYCDRAGKPGPPARTAWCYGDPGVASALLAAGAGTKNRRWRAEAIDLARRAARRPTDETGVVDAGICHGSAGVAHIFNRLYQATGQTVLRDAAIDWYQRTLGFRGRDRGVAGFGALDRRPQRPTLHEVNDRSLLSGAAGIGLALLAAATPVEPMWDRIFLLDVS